MMFNWFNGLTLAQAAAPAAQAGAEAQVSTTAALLQTFLPMILIFVVFYFLLIRPQKKKDKKVKDMLAALKVGDRVCTIGGIYGTIKGVRDDNIILSVGEKDIPMVIARWAIRNVEAVSIENEGDILV